MGRQRHGDKHLPQRVYLRRGSYYYVNLSGKWHNLGRDLSSMYRTLAMHIEISASSSTMNKVFDRYLIEVMPGLAARTQTDYRGYIQNLRPVFGSAPPRQVTPGHVSDYQIKRAERSGGAGKPREVMPISSVYGCDQMACG